MDDSAVICIKCGVGKGAGDLYCPHCGNQTATGAVVCVQCGTALNGGKTAAGIQKSKIAAGLLGIFLGVFGVHNFYLGYTGKAVAQLLITVLTCGACAFVSAIWGLIEGILILTGSTITADANGVPLGD